MEVCISINYIYHVTPQAIPQVYHILVQSWVNGCAETAPAGACSEQATVNMNADPDDMERGGCRGDVGPRTASMAVLGKRAKRRPSAMSARHAQQQQQPIRVQLAPAISQ